MCSKQQNVCSMCGGTSSQQPNYQKQVDPPIPPYGTILGDEPQNDMKGGKCRGGGAVSPPLQICLPGYSPPACSTSPDCSKQTIIQVPKDPVRSCPKIICDACPPPPPTKVWLIKSSPVPQKVGISRLLLFLLSACLPIGGMPDQDCPNQQRIMLCLPCPPVPCQTETKKEEKKKKKGPIGLVTHCKEMDLVGGKLITTCTCGMRNGLSADACPRISCQNNPGCHMIPPMCWPKYQEEKEPEPPKKPAIPKQDIICIPIEFSYSDQGQK
ncbi:UNVERIFIED_CONTAM: hypothetical protein PYX00_000740 [Menopon gallinae]|uniref:Uncharacterized protein n=1 Tax=Menopon gallinae TaxID=328185 RepID=A0AAW2IAG4_9NEOP